MEGKFFSFERAWNAVIAIGFWGIRLVSSTFIYLFIHLFSVDNEIMANVPAVTLCLLAGAFALFSVVGGLKVKLIKIKKLSMSFFIWLIVFMILGFIITKLGLQGIKYFTSGMNVTTHNQELANELLNNIPLYARVFVFGICSVLIEEIFYRGSIIGLVLKEYPKLGLLISSVVFGVAHNPTDIISSTIYISLGALWGVSYLKTKRLELPIVLHIINNIVSILFPNIFS